MWSAGWGSRLDFTAFDVANGESELLHAAPAPSHRRAPVHRQPDYPAASGARLTPRRPAPRRKSSVRLTAFTTAMAGALAFAALTHWGSNARQVRPVVEEADRLAEIAGLGVSQVFLTGHRMTSDRDIFDALDLANARSLLRFDSIAARKRIEQLPWIKQVAITRVFPDSISVEVTERKAFAVWNTSDRDVLIDVTGRILGAAAPSAQADLPRIAGEGAASEAAAILSVVDAFPDVRTRLREAVRVDERRWTLRLADGPDVHLPAGHETEALQALASSRAAASLLDGRRHAEIDLRSPDRIIIRPRHTEEKKTASREGARPSG